MHIPFNISVNLVTIWKLFNKWILKRKEKVMCLKKLFSRWCNKPNPVPVGDIVPTSKRVLLFGINTYPDSPLNGCVNDVNDIEKLINHFYTGVDIRKFTDFQCTRQKIKDELLNSVKALRIGDHLYFHYSGHGTQVYDTHGDELDSYDEAIYAIDGPIVDQEFHEILSLVPFGAYVTLAFDSCFSGTITKLFNIHRNRFYQMPELPFRQKVRKRLAVTSELDSMNWVVLSGCSENQTSADAWIAGKYNGAFTYYMISVFAPELNWYNLMNEIKKYLPGPYYDQIPTLEGDWNLCTSKLFTNN